MSDKYSLVGVDGNAYAIMGYVQKAMVREGHSQKEINRYLSDARMGDYDDLLSVSINQIDELNEGVE